MRLLIVAVVSIVMTILVAYVLSTLTHSQPSKVTMNFTETSPTLQGVTVLVIGGATFPAFQIQYWIKTFREKYPHVIVQYHPVGSGKGIANFKAGLYHIALHDPPLPSKDWEDIRRRYGPVLQCPTVAGAVVVIYNIPGLRGTLNLTGQLLADIFMGKIQDWCDERILRYNPGLRELCRHVKSAPITLVVRHDASGTTYIFTMYLSKVSQEFRELVGADFLPDWSRAWRKYRMTRVVAAEKNFGVAATVRRIPYSIGYVEWSFALFTKIPTAAISSPTGAFVKPTSETIYHAIEIALERGVLEKFNPLADLDKLGVIGWFLNVPDNKSYPIVALSYLSVRLHYDSDEAPLALAIYRFLEHIWVGPESDHMLPGYVAVPRTLREHCFHVLQNSMMIDNRTILSLLQGK